MPGKIFGGKPKELPLGARIRPGGRMAGALLGTIFGGGLGAAAQQVAIQETGEAGALLAKIQAQGTMDPQDQINLEKVLAKAYSQQGILG